MTALNVRLASISSASDPYPNLYKDQDDVRARSRTILPLSATQFFATFAGIPSVVARLIRSAGPLRLAGPPPGPEDRITPFPPVILTISRAFDIQFWRYLRTVSAEVDAGGNNPAE